MLTNLGNDHEFISKEYIFIGTSMRPFGEAQSKAMRAYAQSGQYHTIVEVRDSEEHVHFVIYIIFCAGKK